MLNKLRAVTGAAQNQAEARPVPARFSTLQKTLAVRDDIAALIAASHPSSPRNRRAERHLKEAQKVVSLHELRAEKSAADAAAERDSDLANAAHRKATEEIAAIKNRITHQSDDHTRISSRLEATERELAELKQSADTMLADRQSNFDAAMRDRDDAAQKASAEDLSKAKRALTELGDAAHPTRMRFAALQSQVATGGDAANYLAEKLLAAERELERAKVTLAQIASDRASNLALEAFAAAMALSTGSNVTRPQAMEGFYFWSPERCYAKRYIGMFGRSGFVTGQGIQRLGEMAIEPDYRLLDEDLMQLRATQYTEQEAAVIAADERRRNLGRAQRDWDASLPINAQERIAFQMNNPRPA